jgi:hypothetical protein
MRRDRVRDVDGGHQEYSVDVAESAVDVLAREHRDLQEHFRRVRDPDTNRPAVWLETVKLISAHVAVERSFVYPVVKRQRLGSAHLADLLQHDYRSMEHLVVLTERRKINSPDMPELVTKLLDVFEEHMARCERELIPAATVEPDWTLLKQLLEGDLGAIFAVAGES